MSAKKKSIKLLFFVSGLVFLVTLISTSCYGANPRDIIINEVMYDLAGTDDDHEWIEIFNNSTVSAQLATWRFEEEGTQQQLTLKQGDWLLLAGDYAVIADNADQFLNDNPGFSGTLLDSLFSLSDDGENLKLRDEYNGTVIDDLFYSSGWGGGEGYSLERKSPGGDSNDSDNWQSGSYNGSPGAVNMLPSPTPTPTQVPTEPSTPTSTPTVSPPTPTPTSTPTPRLTPTSIPTPSKEPSPTPTEAGEILGATRSGESTDSLNLSEDKEGKSVSRPANFLSNLLIIGGSLLMVGASYPLWWPKLADLLKKSSKGKEIKNDV